MLELEEARQRILAAVHPVAAETVLLHEAQNRILAEPVVAPLNLPVFDNSAMDGYAVHAEDVAHAAPDSPVRLRVIGRIAAGTGFSGAVGRGTCVRLFTGSPLPPGADAVVMQEDTKTDPARPGEVLVLDAVKPWENVRLRGEDVKAGASVISAGAQLGAAQLALLGALGVDRVQAGRRPVVGLLATGSELVEPGHPLAAGQIHESNRLALAVLSAQAGAQPRIHPIIADQLSATESALERALDECDAVITSGGVSVGEFDFVKDAFHRLGGELSFWKVSIKPGKPFVFGQCRGKLLFGLPGNPVSAFVTCLLLVRPALLRFQGATDCLLPGHPGTLAEPLINRGERRHFMRVAVDPLGQVHSTGVQASHVLGSLAGANGLVDVPPETTLATGSRVIVLRW